MQDPIDPLAASISPSRIISSSWIKKYNNVTYYTGDREGGRPTDKVDQGGAVYPEDKEYHEPGHRDLSTKPPMGQSDFRVT